MKLLALLPNLLLISLTASAPIQDDDKLTIDEDFFPDELAIYTAEHDIVSLFIPLNALNFDDDSDSSEDQDADENSMIFFALADVKEDGDKTDRGLYVLKNGVATKLLENGRDSTADNGDNKLVYFGAKEGLYVYDVKKNEAEKYGSVTDSIIQLAKENGTDTIYVLTEEHQLYKVTEEGTKQTRIDDVIGAREIVLDFMNNLYYFGEDKQPYVVNNDGVKKITGLPASYSFAKLIRPPFIMEDNVPFLIDNQVYYIYANGTSEIGDIVVQARPTAYAMDATLIQYYAFNKKIYEYNILTLLLGGILSELKGFLDDKTDAIQSIATRSRSDMRA